MSLIERGVSVHLISKKKANYRLRTKAVINCTHCIHVREHGEADSTCTLVEGTVDHAHVCDLFDAGTRSAFTPWPTGTWPIAGFSTVHQDGRKGVVMAIDATGKARVDFDGTVEIVPMEQLVAVPPPKGFGVFDSSTVAVDHAPPDRPGLQVRVTASNTRDWHEWDEDHPYSKMGHAAGGAVAASTHVSKPGASPRGHEWGEHGKTGWGQAWGQAGAAAMKAREQAGKGFPAEHTVHHSPGEDAERSAIANRFAHQARAVNAHKTQGYDPNGTRARRFAKGFVNARMDARDRQMPLEAAHEFRKAHEAVAKPMLQNPDQAEHFGAAAGYHAHSIGFGDAEHVVSKPSVQPTVTVPNPQPRPNVAPTVTPKTFPHPINVEDIKPGDRIKGGPLHHEHEAVVHHVTRVGGTKSFPQHSYQITYKGLEMSSLTPVNWTAGTQFIKTGEESREGEPRVIPPGHEHGRGVQPFDEAKHELVKIADVKLGDEVANHDRASRNAFPGTKKGVAPNMAPTFGKVVSVEHFSGGTVHHITLDNGHTISGGSPAELARIKTTEMVKPKIEPTVTPHIEPPKPVEPPKPTIEPTKATKVPNAVVPGHEAHYLAGREAGIAHGLAMKAEGKTEVQIRALSSNKYYKAAKAGLAAGDHPKHAHNLGFAHGLNETVGKKGTKVAPTPPKVEPTPPPRIEPTPPPKVEPTVTERTPADSSKYLKGSPKYEAYNDAHAITKAFLEDAKPSAKEAANVAAEHREKALAAGPGVDRATREGSAHALEDYAAERGKEKPPEPEPVKPPEPEPVKPPEPKPVATTHPSGIAISPSDITAGMREAASLLMRTPSFRAQAFPSKLAEAMEYHRDGHATAGAAAVAQVKKHLDDTFPGGEYKARLVKAAAAANSVAEFDATRPAHDEPYFLGVSPKMLIDREKLTRRIQRAIEGAEVHEGMKADATAANEFMDRLAASVSEDTKSPPGPTLSRDYGRPSTTPNLMGTSKVFSEQHVQALRDTVEPSVSHGTEPMRELGGLNAEDFARHAVVMRKGNEISARIDARPDVQEAMRAFHETKDRAANTKLMSMDDGEKLGMSDEDRHAHNEGFRIAQSEAAKAEDHAGVVQRRATLEELAKERDLGGGAAAHPLYGTKPLVAATREQMGVFPSDWIANSNELSRTSPLALKHSVARGHYSQNQLGSVGRSRAKRIALQNFAAKHGITTQHAAIRATAEQPGLLVHELAHRMEHATTGLGVLQAAHVESRNPGKPSTWLGRGYRLDETTKADEFVEPYVGKRYPTSTHREVISMGTEALFGPTDSTRSDYGRLVGLSGKRADPRLRSFVLGAMALHARKEQTDLLKAEAKEAGGKVVGTGDSMGIQTTLIDKPTTSGLVSRP